MEGKMVDRLLEGIRIIDFSTGRFGGYATMLLADFGADVIKVENIKTNGDVLREAQAMHILIVERKAFAWIIKVLKERK